MDAEHARERLTAQLAELDERARTAERERTDAAPGAEREGALGQHTGDYGSEVTTAMESNLLSDTVAEQRRLVTDALARIDDGTYGTCAVCNQPIDDERLDARPEVITCREHADTPVVV
ncbi:TraR/DksA C4-type zinc finger protein [Actinomycetes bacterium KLBMP 9759]